MQEYPNFHKLGMNCQGFSKVTFKSQNLDGNVEGVLTSDNLSTFSSFTISI
jgi:hypothetical protein